MGARKNRFVSDFFRHQPARVSSRLHVLEPGIYQIRYDSAEDGLHPPRILLSATDDASALVFETSSGHARSQFLEAGDSTLCRAKDQSSLVIVTFSGFGTLSDRISLLIEQLDQASTVGAKSRMKEPPSGAHQTRSVIELTAVNKLGLFWAKGDTDLDLEYSLHIAEWGWIPFMRTGSYLTIPPERMVTGISVRLTGPSASHFQLELECEDDRKRVRTERGHSVLISPLPAPHSIARIGISLGAINAVAGKNPVPALVFRTEPRPGDMARGSL